MGATVIDWDAIEAEYVGGAMSLQALAKANKVPTSKIYDKSRKHEWVRKRAEYRARVASEALEKQRETDVDRLQNVLDSTNNLIDQIAQAISKPDQIYKWFVSEEDESGSTYVERTTSVVNTKAARDMMAILKDGMLVKMTIERVPTIKDLHDLERLKIEQERAKREAAKAAEDSNTKVTFALSPEIEELLPDE